MPKACFEADEMIDCYIHFYNHERIRRKRDISYQRPLLFCLSNLGQFKRPGSCPAHWNLRLTPKAIRGGTFGMIYKIQTA